MKQTITFKEFQALDIRIAKIIQVQEIEGADRLLHITLDVGKDIGERTVAAGIKQWYLPGDLIGKTVVYVVNLEPRTIRGVVSQGMLLAVDDGTAHLLQPDDDVEPGSPVG